MRRNDFYGVCESLLESEMCHYNRRPAYVYRKKKEKKAILPTSVILATSFSTIRNWVIAGLISRFRRKSHQLYHSFVYAFASIKILFGLENLVSTSHAAIILSSPRDSIPSRASPPVPTLYNLPPFFYFRTIDEPENGQMKRTECKRWIWLSYR